MLSDAHLAAIGAGTSGSAVCQQALIKDPWQVTPAIVAKLGDPTVMGMYRNEMHVASAISLGRLGLRTAALEALDRCTHPVKGVLAASLASMPSDVVARDELFDALEENLGALPPRVGDRLRASLGTWREAMLRVRGFRTTSGVVVLLRDDGVWTVFVDDPTIAGLITQGAPRDGPFYLDGFHAPVTVESLFRATRRRPGEVQARLVLMAGSPDEALTSLALRSMAGLLRSGCVEVWCDPDCPGRVRAEALSRFTCTLGWVIAIPMPPGDGTRWTRGEAGRELAAVGEQQRAALTETRQRVDAWDSQQDPKTRWERFHAGRESRLRVFLLTSRYSTYVQHAAADAAAALNRLGCDAVVLKEPDEHSVLSSLGALAEVDRHRPDFVLLINTVRSQLRASLPDHIPVVTWIQDAMPHLFDERTGRDFGEHDFIVGHLHEELFTQFGFPRRRTLSTPVLASDIKFHDAPMSAQAGARFVCDIAYVSHQSETPEQFRDRVLSDTERESWTSRMLPHLFPQVVNAASNCDIFGQRLHDTLRDATVAALRAGMGTEPPARVLALALHTVARPLAERVLRQQIMGWAADLCDQKGWKLHVYGRGWDTHPRFARYARGALDHGDDLRAAYQCATLQLHAGLGGVHHQRVMECALSGGCTLVRLKAEDVRLLECWAQNEVATQVDRATLRPAFPDRSDYFLCPIADHWQAAKVQSLYDRLGIPPQHDRVGQIALHADQIQTPWAHRGGVPMPYEAAWLAGDPAESGFWDRQSFERVVTRVVESPSHRASLAQWQRDATKQHFSLSSFMHRMLGLLDDSMRDSAAMTATSR